VFSKMVINMAKVEVIGKWAISFIDSLLRVHQKYCLSFQS